MAALAAMEPIAKTSRWALSPAGATVGGLVMNISLGAAKVVAGLLCHSQAIMVDGLHSASDAASDIAVLGGLRISGRPPDASHPYGHRRAMSLVSLLLAGLLVTAGAYVFYAAVVALAERAHVRSQIRTTVPLVLAILSIVIKEALYHVTIRVARRAGDSSLVANAWHHRSDAASSLAAAVGLAGVAIGGPKWHFLDHLTAGVLSSFLAVVAWRIIRQAVDELMDRAPEAELLKRIEESVLGTQGVRGFHGFRARQLSGQVEMDIHVQVDPELTVRQGHDIASEVRRRVVDRCPNVVTVIVHVEPAEQQP